MLPPESACGPLKMVQQAVEKGLQLVWMLKLVVGFGGRIAPAHHEGQSLLSQRMKGRLVGRVRPCVNGNSSGSRRRQFSRDPCRRSSPIPFQPGTHL